MIKYRVTICTGNVGGGGTDASVFLNVIGDLGDTGERLMIMSKNNVNKFEKGNVRSSAQETSLILEKGAHLTLFSLPLSSSTTSSSLSPCPWARYTGCVLATMVGGEAVGGSLTR